MEALGHILKQDTSPSFTRVGPDNDSLMFSVDEDGLYLFHAAILSLRTMQRQSNCLEGQNRKWKGDETLQ